MLTTQAEQVSTRKPILPKGTGKVSSASRVILLLWLLPLLAYCAVMILSVLWRGPLAFGLDDLALLFLALAYAGGGACLAGWRRAEYLGRFVACVYSVLIAATLGEVVLRQFRPALQNVPMQRVRTILTPGDNMPGIKGPVEYTANGLGVRGPEARLEDFDVRILCVGASTTECLYVTDKQTWPWLVMDRLTQKLGKPVFVGNTGRAGHITLNHDYLLNNYPLASRYNWVVVFCGWNDMAAMLNTRRYETIKERVGTWTLQNAPAGRRQAYYGELAILQRLEEVTRKPEGALQDPRGLWIDEQRQRRVKALKTRTIREVPREELERALVIYRENLNQIINTCRRHNQQLVMMNSPTMHRKDLPAELASLTWFSVENEAYTSEVLAELIAAYNRTMIEVCKQRGVDCIDLASLLPRDTTAFYDDCHLNIGGCDKVATLVTDYFVGKLKPTDQAASR
jgi:hypothetical protein